MLLEPQLEASKVSPVSPKISGQVDRPLTLTAVYERQVNVSVTSPLGSAGDGWHKAGAAMQVVVPSQSQRWLIFNRRLVGFGEYPSDHGVVSLTPNEPISLTALYETVVNLKVLLLLGAIPAELVLLNLLVRRFRASSQQRNVRLSAQKPAEPV